MCVCERESMRKRMRETERAALLREILLTKVKLMALSNAWSSIKTKAETRRNKSQLATRLRLSKETE